MLGDTFPKTLLEKFTICSFSTSFFFASFLLRVSPLCLLNESVNESVSEWISESVSEWISESVNELISGLSYKNSNLDVLSHNDKMADSLIISAWLWHRVQQLQNKISLMYRKQTKHCQSFLTGFISLTPAGRDLLSGLVTHSGLEEEEGERGDLSFLQDLLSPGASTGADDFSKVWQDAFGCFEAPASAPCSTHTTAAGSTNATRSPSQPPSPTGFLPSQLLDHGLSPTG